MVVKELVALLGLDVDDATFEKGEALIQGLKTGLLATVGSLAAVGLGMLELARETANAGNDAYKLSLRLGTTTDAAQELAYAAEATGASAESLQTSMFHMSRTIESAKEGSVEAQKALTGMGVPLHELYRLKPDEQFTRLAGGLSKVKDQSAKASHEQAIFGRGVVELIPLIEKGEDGIRGFREEAHEMGLVLSQETIAESREWQLQMRQAGEQLDALKFKVGSFVLHGLLQMSKGWHAVAKSFKDWMAFKPDNVLNIVKLALWALTAATVVWAAVNADAIGLAVVNYARMGVVALASAARAILAFALMDATLIGVGITIFAVGLGLNDIYHFFKGDKATLIGDTIAYWNREFHSFGEAVESVGRWFAYMTGGEGYTKTMDKMYADFSVPEINRRTEERRKQRAAAGENTGGDLGQMLSPITDPAQIFSPAAMGPTPAGVGVLSPMSTVINVYSQPGMSEKELAGQVRSALDDWHHTKVREAIAHVE